MNQLTSDTIELLLGNPVNNILFTKEELIILDSNKPTGRKTSKLYHSGGGIPFHQAFKSAVLARIVELGAEEQDIAEIENKLIALLKTAKKALALNNRQMYQWSICEGRNYDVTLDLNERGELSVFLVSIKAVKPRVMHVMVNATAILRNMLSCCIASPE
jgi:hypothetical protein